MSWVISLFIMLVFYQQIYAKIRIIIPVYNRPEFIELQAKCFKKFLKDDYEILMFNDADNEFMRRKIEEECSKFDVACILVPQELHNVDPNCYRAVASFRHGEVLQFAFENYGYHHNDIVAVFDSDVFLIQELSLRNYLQGYDINGHVWGDSNNPIWGAFVHYCVMNMPMLKDPETFIFRAKFEDGAFDEPGHGFFEYHRMHRDLKIKEFHYIPGVLPEYLKEYFGVDLNKDIYSQLKVVGYTEAQINLVQSLHAAIDEASAMTVSPQEINKLKVDCDVLFFDINLFLDYKHGSNWHSPGSIQYVKDKIVKNFIYSLLGLEKQ